MENITLSYEDVPYEEQVARNLKDRLGNTRVYLYEDVSKSAKRIAKLLDEQNEGTEEELVTADGRRLNALTLTGLPISCLKTQALFAYSTHFDAAPTGLEWINDWTVVFVYPSGNSAKKALRNLRKFFAEDPDNEDFVTAKPIPVNLWPPGSRVQISLGGEPEAEVLDMKSRICIRIAKSTDVKEKGARSTSEFYKKHGEHAGKEMYGFSEQLSQPRGKRRRDDFGDTRVKRARLDDGSSETLYSSGEVVEDPGEASTQSLRDRISGPIGTRRVRGKRPTKQSLDDELDAFLKEKD